MVTVNLAGDYIEYSENGRMFYDARIPDESSVSWYIRHMSDKMWFTAEVRARTMEIIRHAHGEQENAA